MCSLASYCTDRERRGGGGGGGERTLFTIVVEETQGLFTFRPRGGGGERERERETDRHTERERESIFNKTVYSKFNFLFVAHVSCYSGAQTKFFHLRIRFSRIFRRRFVSASQPHNGVFQV